MSERRITKGWTHFGSNILDVYSHPSYIERGRKDRKVNNILRNTHKLSLEDLEKERVQAEKNKAAAKEKYNKAVKEGKIKPKKKRNFKK